MGLLDETERSIHDALCVVRSLVKKKALIPGGGAAEMEVSQKLMQWARSLGGVEAVCVEHFAEALEVVPYTLAENAGMQAVEIVTKLRAAHVQGDKHAGINVRRGTISNLFEERVVQPLLDSCCRRHQGCREKGIQWKSNKGCCQGKQEIAEASAWLLSSLTIFFYQKKGGLKKKKKKKKKK